MEMMLGPSARLHWISSLLSNQSKPLNTDNNNKGTPSQEDLQSQDTAEAITTPLIRYSQQRLFIEPLKTVKPCGRQVSRPSVVPPAFPHTAALLFAILGRPTGKATIPFSSAPAVHSFHSIPYDRGILASPPPIYPSQAPGRHPYTHVAMSSPVAAAAARPGCVVVVVACCLLPVVVHGRQNAKKKKA